MAKIQNREYQSADTILLNTLTGTMLLTESKTTEEGADTYRLYNHDTGKYEFRELDLTGYEVYNLNSPIEGSEDKSLAYLLDKGDSFSALKEILNQSAGITDLEAVFGSKLDDIKKLCKVEYDDKVKENDNLKKSNPTIKYEYQRNLMNELSKLNLSEDIYVYLNQNDPDALEALKDEREVSLSNPFLAEQNRLEKIELAKGKLDYLHNELDAYKYYKTEHNVFGSISELFAPKPLIPALIWPVICKFIGLCSMIKHHGPGMTEYYKSWSQLHPIGASAAHYKYLREHKAEFIEARDKYIQELRSENSQNQLESTNLKVENSIDSPTEKNPLNELSEKSKELHQKYDDSVDKVLGTKERILNLERKLDSESNSEKKQEIENNISKEKEIEKKQIDKVLKLGSEIEKNQSKIKDLIDKKEKVEKDSDSKDSKTEQKSENSDNDKEKTNEKEKLEKIEEKVNELLEKDKISEAEEDSLDEMIEDLKNDIDKMEDSPEKEELLNKLNELEDKIEEKLNENKKDNIESKETIEKNENNSKNVKIESSNSGDIKEKAVNINQLEKKVAENINKDRSISNDLNFLIDHGANLKTNINSFLVEIGPKISNIFDLQKQSLELYSQRDDLQSKIDNLQIKIDNLDIKINSLKDIEKEYKALAKEYNKESHELYKEKNSLEKESKSNSEKIQKIEVEIQKVEQKIDELTDEKIDLLNQKAELEKELEAKEKAIEQKESQLDAELRSYYDNDFSKEMLDATSKEKAVLEKEKASIEKQIDNLNKKIEAKTKEITDKTNSIENKTNFVESLNQKATEITGKLEVNKSNIDKLNDNFEIKQEKINSLENDLKELTSSKKELKQLERKIDKFEKTNGINTLTLETATRFEYKSKDFSSKCIEQIRMSRDLMTSIDTSINDKLDIIKSYEILGGKENEISKLKIEIDGLQQIKLDCKENISNFEATKNLLDSKIENQNHLEAKENIQLETIEDKIENIIEEQNEVIDNPVEIDENNDISSELKELSENTDINEQNEVIGNDTSNSVEQISSLNEIAKDIDKTSAFSSVEKPTIENPEVKVEELSVSKDVDFKYSISCVDKTIPNTLNIEQVGGQNIDLSITLQKGISGENRIFQSLEAAKNIDYEKPVDKTYFETAIKDVTCKDIKMINDKPVEEALKDKDIVESLGSLLEFLSDDLKETVENAIENISEIGADQIEELENNENNDDEYENDSYDLDYDNFSSIE